MYENKESIDKWVGVELKHGKSKHHDAWGRKIVQAIDMDDCIALFEAFETKEVNTNSSNVKHIDAQTTIYGYGEYLWTTKIHQFLGDTALHLALKQQKLKCVHMLLVLKANRLIENEVRMTAEDLCAQILNTNLTNLAYDSINYILNNLNPKKFHRLPDGVRYRSLETEAWELMRSGRILYTELPTSFGVASSSGLPVTSEEKRAYLSFNLDEADVFKDEDSLGDVVKGRLQPKDKKVDAKTSKLKRQWTRAKDEGGRPYFYDQTTGDSTYEEPADLYTSKFIPLLSADAQTEKEYEAFVGRIGHVDSLMATFKGQIEEVRLDRSLGNNARKLAALREAQLESAKKDGPYFARYIEIKRLKTLLKEKGSAMREHNRKSYEDERRGVSLTPGAEAVGDVWSRGTLTDILGLIRRQTARRAEAAAASDQFTAKGLSLLGSVKQSSAGERVLAHEERLLAGDKVSFADIPHELQQQAGLKKLKFLKMGQFSAVQSAATRAHAVPVSTKEGSVTAASPSKRLVSTIADPLIIGKGSGLPVVGFKGTSTFNDTLQSTAGRASPNRRALLYDPLTHMNTVDYHTAREITELSTLNNLKYLKIGDDGLEDLSEALADDLIIRSMNLSNARVTCRSVCLFAAVLPTMSALTYLDLSGNVIADAGAVALAGAIGSETCLLEKLCLSGNRIGVKGCLALVQAVLHSPLKYLSLFNNKLEQDDVQSLQKMLEEHSYAPRAETERTTNQIRAGRNRRFRGSLPTVFSFRPLRVVHSIRGRPNAREDLSGFDEKSEEGDSLADSTSEPGEKPPVGGEDESNPSDDKTIVL